MADKTIIQNALELLKNALNGDSANPFSELALWPEIKKELQANTVFPLVSDYMMRTELPAEEKAALLRETAVNVREFHMLMTAQEAALKLLEEHDIPVAVIKGAAAAQYYPRPELRQYGDIDIIVPREDYSKACKLLASSGYKEELDMGRHTEFITPQGIRIELHRHFFDGLDEAQNALMDGRLQKKLKEVRKITLAGYQVTAYPSLDNGLILLGHIRHHLSGGLGLRQIIDWMLFVRSELDDAFWDSEFAEAAEAAGMTALAKTVTKLCQKYLGLDSGITWCADADEAVVDDLLLFLFESGNFGAQKERDVSVAPATALHYLNPLYLFPYLTRAGCLHMEEEGKTANRAYAWLYELGFKFKQNNETGMVRWFKRKATGQHLSEQLKK